MVILFSDVSDETASLGIIKENTEAQQRLEVSEAVERLMWKLSVNISKILSLTLKYFKFSFQLLKTSIVSNCDFEDHAKSWTLKNILLILKF